jgi:hypothetical protein
MNNGSTMPMLCVSAGINSPMHNVVGEDANNGTFGKVNQVVGRDANNGSTPPLADAVRLAGIIVKMSGPSSSLNNINASRITGD